MLPSLVLADIGASGALDGSAVLYRLGYADSHQLRPYAHARWSAPPPQLVQERLRQQLARQRPILDLGDSAALARNGGVAPRVLRIDLEEFSHLFESQAQSWGVLRLRATVMDSTPAGEKLLAQRSFVVRQAAPTPDAPGGVRALAAATDAAAEEIGQWLAQLR
jgi:cholesterol transport system auxiliary component